MERTILGLFSMCFLRHVLLIIKHFLRGSNVLSTCTTRFSFYSLLKPFFLFSCKKFGMCFAVRCVLVFLKTFLYSIESEKA